MNIPQDFFTIGFLATFAGMVLAVNVVVYFFKDYIKKFFGDAGVRPFAAVIAFTIQMFVLYVQGDFILVKIGLAVLNAFIVALTAFGTYEVIKDPLAKITKSLPSGNNKITLPVGTSLDNSSTPSNPVQEQNNNIPVK